MPHLSKPISHTPSYLIMLQWTFFRDRIGWKLFSLKKKSFLSPPFFSARICAWLICILMASFGLWLLGKCAVTNYFYDSVLRFFAAILPLLNCSFMPRNSHHVDKVDKPHHETPFIKSDGPMTNSILWIHTILLLSTFSFQLCEIKAMSI